MEWSVLTTTEFPNNVVPLPALSAIRGDSFIGNIAGATGTPTGVVFTAVDSASIIYNTSNHALERAALTGDVAAVQNSNTTIIANNAVTFGKMQTLGPHAVLGNSAGSTGTMEKLNVSSPLLAEASTLFLSLSQIGDQHLAVADFALTGADPTLGFRKSYQRNFVFDDWEAYAGAPITTAGVFFNTTQSVWLCQAGGANGTSAISGLMNHPGIVTFQTGATSGNSITVTRATTITGTPLVFDDVFQMEIVFRIPDVANSQFEFGMSNGLFAVDTNCVTIQAILGNVTVQCISGGSATTSTTVATISNNVWYYWLVTVNASGFWEFYQNGSLINTVTSTIPTTAGGAIGFFCRSRSAGAKNFDIDYVAYETRNLQRF